MPRHRCTNDVRLDGRKESQSDRACRRSRACPPRRRTSCPAHPGHRGRSRPARRCFRLCIVGADGVGHCRAACHAAPGSVICENMHIIRICILHITPAPPRPCQPCCRAACHAAPDRRTCETSAVCVLKVFPNI